MNFPGLIGPTYVSQSRLVGYERCVNFYLEKNESPDAVVPWALYPTPGLSAFATIAEGPNRGLFAQDGRAFSVSGYVLYELESTGLLPTNRGNVARDANPATLASSGDAGAQLCIGSGALAYIFDLTLNTLGAAIVGLVANQVAYLDGYFLALDQGTSKLRISNLLAGTTWDPTQFTQRSAAGDKWKALLVSGQYIWLFGSETSDVWNDVGAFPFPFAPVQGALVQMGIAAPWSAVDMSGQPYWLSQTNKGNGIVVRANGFGLPERISTHAVETAIAGYGTISDAIGFSYQIVGHDFYVLTFPTANATWVFDKTSGQWHEWLYLNPVTGQYESARVTSHCVAFGKHLGGDRATGTVWSMSTNTFTDGADPIRRMRSAPLPKLTAEKKWMFFSALELEAEVGLGLQAGQGSDPQIALRISRDGGKTYGSEVWASAGRVGEYNTQILWNRLGRYLDGRGVVELVMTDPIPWRLLGGDLDIREGTH